MECRSSWQGNLYPIASFHSNWRGRGKLFWYDWRAGATDLVSVKSAERWQSFDDREINLSPCSMSMREDQQTGKCSILLQPPSANYHDAPISSRFKNGKQFQQGEGIVRRHFQNYLGLKLTLFRTLYGTKIDMQYPFAAYTYFHVVCIINGDASLLQR